MTSSTSSVTTTASMKSREEKAADRWEYLDVACIKCRQPVLSYLASYFKPGLMQIVDLSCRESGVIEDDNFSEDFDNFPEGKVGSSNVSSAWVIDSTLLSQPSKGKSKSK